MMQRANIGSAFWRELGLGALVAGLALALATPIQALVVVNDSWADGGRTNGADPQDTNWWSSTNSSAIEVGSGFMGLVTGTSGRGIHGTYAAQTLAEGDTLTATYTFTTPATVGTNGSTALRIGLFNSNGSNLAANIVASSGSPNALYNALQGYMVDYDVNLAGANIQFRERSVASGQMMASTADFTNVGSGGGVLNYTFAANTSYTGVLSIAKTPTGLTLTSSLSQGATLLTSHTATDLTPSTSIYDVLAFHVNSNTFGSSATPGTAATDNGINFSNITIELTTSAVPEAGSVLFGAVAASVAGVGGVVRRRGVSRRGECWVKGLNHKRHGRD